MHLFAFGSRVLKLVIVHENFRFCERGGDGFARVELGRVLVGRVCLFPVGKQVAREHVVEVLVRISPRVRRLARRTQRQAKFYER